MKMVREGMARPGIPEADASHGKRARRISRLPLLSIALAGGILLGCKKDGAPAPAPEAGEQEAWHYTPSPPAWKTVPDSASHEGAVPSPPAPNTYGEAIQSLRDSGFGSIADIIEKRVSRQKPKMKLSGQEGLRAAIYVLQDLSSMPRTLELSRIMPKTAIELLRGVNERGVTTADAEEMAAYLSLIHSSLRMRNPGPFDENNSHCIGREWREIDYSDENMTWEGQMRHYQPLGVENFKKASYLRRFFELESRYPYFRRIYKPEGSLPE